MRPGLIPNVSKEPRPCSHGRGSSIFTLSRFRATILHDYHDGWTRGVRQGHRGSGNRQSAGIRVLSIPVRCTRACSSLAVIRRQVSCDDWNGVGGILAHISLEMPTGRVFLNGEDITEAIRRPEISQGASKVAEIPAVRAFLIPQQRQIAAGRNIICEGRDQGTVVFPDSPLKFFITGDVRTRAERRYKQHREQGLESTMEQEIADLKVRDKRDSEREAQRCAEPPMQSTSTQPTCPRKKS